MPKAYCYLSDKTIEKLNEIQEKEEHESFSQTMKDMVQLGINVYIHGKENPTMDDTERLRLEREEELRSQHTTYLLRIMEINADIFRCVFDKNKMIDSSENTEERIAIIKKKADDFVASYLTAQKKY